MKRILLILVGAGMATCAAPAPAAESLSETLQNGLFEEEANHNLDAAIKAYQSVITGHEDQRRLTATAVFRLGECYRKLGKTNEAAGQYQRVLSEFLDQPALANLSRQNLVGLGISSSAQQPGSSTGAADRYRALTPAARVKLKDLLQEQIRLAEKNLAEQRKRVEVGTMAPEELFRFQKEVLSLKREQLLVDGLGTPESREQWRSLVLEEIDLAEKALTTERRRVDNGRAAPSELIARQQEVLALKRELLLADTVSDATASRSDETAPATDEEEKEVRRITALIRNSPDLINATDKTTGGTPLHKATASGHLTVARFLLSNKANVNSRNGGGGTPLHMAASAGHRSMVELLLANGADVNAQGSNDGATPLHLAAANGFRSIVEVLLANKANPNLRDNSGEAPLHRAAAKSIKPVAETLLAHGAEVDAKNNDGRTPLLLAAINDSSDIIPLLLAHKADPNARDGTNRQNPNKTTVGRTPLHYAAERGDKAVVELLMSNGAEVDAKANDLATPLFLAVANGKPPAFVPVVELLLAKGADPNVRVAGETLLIVAARNGLLEIATALLQAKADVHLAATSDNAKGWTPLHHAVGSKNQLMTELLLKKGADPNKPIGTLYSNYTGTKGATCLHIAAVNNSPPELLTLLLEAKGNPNAKTEGGYTPLHYSLHYFDAAQVVLEHGADVEVRNPEGNTPLAAAVMWGLDETVKLLLAHKANVNARSSDGLTPLHKAIVSKKKAAFDLLLAAGADVNATDSQGRTPLDYLKGGAPQPRPGQPAPPVFAGGSPFPGSTPVLTLQQEEMLDALRQSGAVEWAPRAGQITVTRRSFPLILPVFFQSTNALNHHTLLEAIVAAGPPVFPDFAKVKVARVDRQTGKTIDVPVDAAALVQSGDCSKDILLEWGDTVEIPEREHKLNESWSGVPYEVGGRIAKCLERKVTLAVKGRTETLNLETERSGNPSGLYISMKFGLKRVVLNSGMLLTSSDLSRVKVERVDPKTGEKHAWVFNLEKDRDSRDELWLRDGDVIEVPDRDPNAPATRVGSGDNVPERVGTSPYPSPYPIPGRALPPRTIRQVPPQD